MTYVVGAGVSIEVTANTMPAQASLGAMNERIHETHGAMGAMMGQMASFVGGQIIFAVLARAMMEVEKQIKDVATKTEEWDTALADLDAGLKSTAGVAGWTRQNAIDLANSLSTVTKYSNIAVLSVEDLALTFTGISAKVMPDAVGSILDLASKMKEDTKSAAIQLGKALQDPILGMTTLRRVGVDFTKQDAEMVKGWVLHGEKAKAVAFILHEIHTEFGGNTQAEAQTLGGRLQVLNNQFDIMKETVGNALVPVLEQLLGGLVPLIGAMAKGLPGALKTVGDAFQAVGWYMTNLRVSNMGPLMDGMKAMQKFMDGTFLPAFTQLKDFLLSWLIPAIAQLAGWFAQKILPIILAVAGVIMTNFMPTIEMLASKIIEKLLPPLQRLAAQILPVLIPLFAGLGWVFQNVVGPVLGWIIDRIGNLLDLLGFAIDALKVLFNNLGKIGAMASGAGQALHGMHIPGFAEGGVTAGGLSIVGERGPEIVALPSGSRVYPNGAGPAGGAGMSAQAQPIILQINGQTLARLLLPPMVTEIRQHAAIRSQ
jgi:hypothetical protein